MKGTFRKEVREPRHGQIDSHCHSHHGRAVQIVASINPAKPVPLEQFGRTMLTKYHAPIIPATVPKDTMAALAFLVRVHLGDET